MTIARIAYLLAAAFFAVAVLPAHAEPKQIPAYLASGTVPVPTFRELHEQYMRIVVNESGFKSLADQDGILQSLLFQGGGRRRGRGKRGQGYGLDYSKLMKRMAGHSKRTFPVSSKFLAFTPEQRARLAKRQTRQNQWTSTLTVDCAEPVGWPEFKLDGSPMDPWLANFGKRCALVASTTRAFLKGELESYCDGQPTTWGSHIDIRRPGGALDQGWAEIGCNRPNPDNPGEDCRALSKQELRNSRTCARNTFWTWLVDKEDRNADKEEPGESGQGERNQGS